MKRRSEPVDIKALRKTVTLDPKRKNMCTACGQKMRPPGPKEDPTPTCDDCAHGIVIDILPKLLDELEAARAAKAEPKPSRTKAKPERKKTSKRIKKSQLAPKLEAVDHPARLHPEQVQPLTRNGAKPDPDESEVAFEAEDEEDVEDENDDEAEAPKKPDPEPEIDEATDVSSLALALEDVQPEKPRPRRRVQFVPASQQEVQATVIQLRTKFEK